MDRSGNTNSPEGLLVFLARSWASSSRRPQLEQGTSGPFLYTRGVHSLALLPSGCPSLLTSLSSFTHISFSLHNVPYGYTAWLCTSTQHATVLRLQSLYFDISLFTILSLFDHFLSLHALHEDHAQPPRTCRSMHPLKLNSTIYSY